MKALVFQDGELKLATDRPLPLPREGEALVRVRLSGICATDLEIIKGYMGFEGVPGHEFVGTVEHCPAQPELAGRRVVGEINISCGQCACCDALRRRHCPNRSVLGILGKDGAFAEYLTLPLENLHLVPDNVPDEAAVFVEPLAAAFEILEQVELGAQDKVCLLGDGRLGLLIAQVLALKTPSLLVIGRHPAKLALLGSQGIATATEAPEGSDREFDLVVDASGGDSLRQALSLVKPRGKIVLKTTTAAPRAIDLNQLVIDEISLIGSRCGPFPPAIAALANGQVQVMPLIDRSFSLSESVAALEYAGRPGVKKVLLRG